MKLKSNIRTGPHLTIKLIQAGIAVTKETSTDLVRNKKPEYNKKRVKRLSPLNCDLGFRV